MNTNGFLKIDSVQMPTPVRADATEYDLDTANTGRPESGYLHRERKRKNVMSLALEWKGLTQEQAQLIHDAIEPPEFLCEFRFLGRLEQRQMYAGDRKWVEQYSSDERGAYQADLTVTFSEY